MAIVPLNQSKFIHFPNGKIIGGLTYIKTGPDTYEPWDGTVDISFGATSIAINDGVDNGIKATVIESTDEPGIFGLVALNPDGSNISGGGGGGGAVTIANGADVNAGNTADAAVVGDNSGTLSAKLRGISSILADVWDNANNRLNVFIQNTTLAVTQSGSWVLSAGSAIIGNVRIDQTTPGTTNGVVVNSSALPTGASTLSEQQTQTALLAIPTTIFNGKTNVTTAGTRVALAGSQVIKSVTIKALVGNTGLIYVGNSSVSSSNGFQLSPGDSISLNLTNLATINIDSAINGEGVSYLGVN